MNITNVTVNLSQAASFMFNSPGGQQLYVTPGVTTDATVITQLMGGFFWFEILFYFIILFFLAMQVIIERKSRKNPSFASEFGWLTQVFSEMAGMSLVFITIVNLGIWLWRMNHW